jgi:hypothetical protein
MQQHAGHASRAQQWQRMLVQGIPDHTVCPSQQLLHRDLLDVHHSSAQATAG